MVLRATPIPDYSLGVVRYPEIPPPPALSAFLVLEQDHGFAAPQRIVPDSNAELIMDLAEPFEAHRNERWHLAASMFLFRVGYVLLKTGGFAFVPAHDIQRLSYSSNIAALLSLLRW